MAKLGNTSEAPGGGSGITGRFSVTGIARNSGGISGSAGRNVTPTYRNGGNAEISENVKIVGAKSPSGKVSLRGGSSQVLGENLRSGAKTTASEAKANARGLSSATGKLSKGNAAREYAKDKVDMIMKSNPGDTKADAERWSAHPGHASQKSNARLQKGKWSSEKQIARYQKSEIKDFRKPKK